jgi:2-dehydropantoate 2-reductase
MTGQQIKIGIIGGGAVGLTYAALLSEVANVRILTRRHEQAEHLSGGIRFETRQGQAKQYPDVRASADYSDLRDCDAIIVAVKSYDTEEMAQNLAENIKDDAVVLTLQNGIEAFNILRSHLKNPDRVMAGVTYVGASRKNDTTVVNGDNFITIVDSRAAQLVEAMEATRLEVQASKNVRQAVWDKLVLNVAQNALSAVTNLNFGEMLESKDCLDTAAHLLAEFKLVSTAEGLHFEYGLIDKLKDNWRGSTFYPSMWQDLHHGRPTEIDAINGAISKLGKKHGIETPYNDEIVAKIKALEKSKTALTY